MANFTYPKGTSTRVVKVTLSEEDYRQVKQLGEGYASHGLRKTIRLAEQALLYKRGRP